MAEQVDSAALGQVVFVSNAPTALTSSADTVFTFAQPVLHVFIQNKSATAVYMEFDSSATVGSILIAAAGIQRFDVSCSAIHLFSTAATNVNGTADLNIVLKGWG